MKRETKNPNRLTFKNKNIVQQYLKAKDLRDNRLWSIAGNVCVTFFGGQWLSLSEFEEKFPILKQNSLLSNPDNPNKKRNWSI